MREFQTCPYQCLDFWVLQNSIISSHAEGKPRVLRHGNGEGKQRETQCPPPHWLHGGVANTIQPQLARHQVVLLTTGANKQSNGAVLKETKRCKGANSNEHPSVAVALETAQASSVPPETASKTTKSPGDTSATLSCSAVLHSKGGHHGPSS